ECGCRRSILGVVSLRVPVRLSLQLSGLPSARGGQLLASDLYPAGRPGPAVPAAVLVLLPEPPGVLPLRRRVPRRMAAGVSTATSADTLRHLATKGRRRQGGVSNVDRSIYRTL